ncbi:hypothetical protein [Paludibaculum fermentans]|uniref:Uncharacterized protein n=1 Tax=Paludibaculum fermentans TaxID=1473598 RepID=A0A7S7NKY8_PALFE|nr:hypothetical protein [Paludibaculum fermentans]QOY85527.1 hypothetical protein IRI77_22165 [Paludibaculum fermentans]
MSSGPMDSTPRDQQLAERLRQAVRSQEAPPELAVKIRQRLDEERRAGRSGFGLAMVWLPAAAALVISIAAGIVYQQGHLRLTAGQRESFMSSMLVKVSTAMRPGLDDHLHCSVYGKVPHTIPPLAQAVKDLPPQFAEVLTVVQQQAPQSFQLYSAHLCTRHGRKFVHFQLKSNSKLLSVIITRRNVEESFVRDQIVPELKEHGVALYEARAARFQLAAIETKDYLAYVVSDLGSEENRNLMLAMAPGIQSVLRRLES